MADLSNYPGRYGGILTTAPPLQGVEVCDGIDYLVREIESSRCCSAWGRQIR